jgi:hypothetical protein
MRRTLRLIGVVAVLWVVCVLALLILLRLCGYPGFIVGLMVLTAWLGHTLESRAACADIERALMACGIAKKEAAITMGVTPQQFGNQLAGDEMLSFSRLASLPPAFWIAFAKARLERFSTGVVIESQELVDLINAVQALVPTVRPARKSEAA